MEKLDQSSQELFQDLQSALQGEVRFDPLYRQIYSTDASCYRVVPAGVLLPRGAEDVIAAIETAIRHKVSLVPRGSGTSLAGQAVGPGLVVDCTRSFDKILAIQPEEGWAQVEAGVTLDALNAAAQPHGLMVGPNPASAAVATLGGMAANNSTGSHSISYGLMIDHVLEIDAVLSDGHRCTLGPKSPAQVAVLAGQAGLEGELYRQVPRLVDQYREEIATGYPHTWRNVAGYALNRLLADRQSGRPFSLVPLITGSEGTLAFILNLKVHLVHRPRFTRLAVLHFDDLRRALEAVPWILERRPSAVELLDHIVIQNGRAHPIFRPRLARFVQGDPSALLVVEFSGDEPDGLAARAAEFESQYLRELGPGPVVHCASPDDIENVWSVRRELNGLLQCRPGDERPLSFVDDAAVPVDQLPDYVAEVQAACHAAGVEVNFDAHASAGCLHLAPAINLKVPEGLRRMQEISQAVMEIAIRHHGTTTGEHGEGLARSYYNEQLYGPRLHQAFRQVKGIFDPDNLMNPGKIVESPLHFDPDNLMDPNKIVEAPLPFDLKDLMDPNKIVESPLPWDPGLLRYNPGYQIPQAPAKTFINFEPYPGFAGMVEMCNGQGLCRFLGSGVMCPSYRVTRDEMHSTRGRANALRAAMSGELGPQGMSSHALYEALDLCLECKACKRECSSLVDMARLKAEFLAQYQAQHGVPLRSRLFGHVASLYRLGSLAPGLANFAFRNSLFRSLLDRLLGIDRRRSLPALSGQTFQAWFNSHARPASAPNGPVILWDDCYLSYQEPEIGIAAVRVLETAGFEVRLPAGRWCCGRPMISKGLLADARRNAAHNLSLLAPLAAQGLPILGIEPSCIAAFRDEYPALLPGEDARRVAENSFFIEEFLASLAQQGRLRLPFAAPQETRRVLVHGHCYQKAIATTSPLMAMMRLLPDTLVEEIPSGCCGMAGSFGYEKEHYAISMACAEDRLLPAVRRAGPETIIAAAGTSCRTQIQDGSGRRAIHPIQVLANAIQG